MSKKKKSKKSNNKRDNKIVLYLGFFAVVLVIAIVFLGLRGSDSEESMVEILDEAVENQSLIVDVREYSERISAGYIETSVNYPLYSGFEEYDIITYGDSDDPTLSSSDNSYDKTYDFTRLFGDDLEINIYIYCASGNRSQLVTDVLEAYGYTSVTDLGGYSSNENLQNSQYNVEAKSYIDYTLSESDSIEIYTNPLEATADISYVAEGVYVINLSFHRRAVGAAGEDYVLNNTAFNTMKSLYLANLNDEESNVFEVLYSIRDNDASTDDEKTAIEAMIFIAEVVNNRAQFEALV